MPLQHSSSDSAFKSNLHTLFHEVGQSPHVKDRSQALAIAYAIKRRGKAGGGGLASNGMAMPQPAAPTAPAATGMAAPAVSNTPVAGLGMTAPTPAALHMTAPMTMPMANQGGLGAQPPGSWTPPSNGGMSPAAPIMRGPITSGTFPSAGGATGMAASPGSAPAPIANGAASSFQGGLGNAPNAWASNPAMMAAWRARRGYAFGGAPAPWQVRQEARNMLHSGPIMSAVPGRTDRHNMSLAAGSYVIPSQAVSHLGQNNTQAGFKVLNTMFGKQGPAGAGEMAIRPGHGAPKPPGLAKFAYGGGYDLGGGRGDDTGQPVDVVTAGGEYVLTPEQVASVGGGDVNHGHEVLDAWVNQIKQDHIRTLKKLPGPAKS